MRRRSVDVVALVGAGALVWLAFGWPDLADAVGLLRSADPSHRQLIAAVGLVAWTLDGAMALVVFVPMVRTSGPSARAVVVLVLGLALLCAGIGVHASRGTHICCGSTPKAEQALGTAP